MRPAPGFVPQDRHGATVRASPVRFVKRPLTCSPPVATLDKIAASMPISQELLDILVCPVCKAKVVIKEDGSGLKCVECKRVYPIRDDIPVMLVDQATVEP